MLTRLRAVWERMRATYWAVPSLMAAASLALSFWMIDLDTRLTSSHLDELSWVYTGGADGARAVLSTVASSMITVAGVAFSITIVALTLASQQFGPRLLRNFLRDLGNQVTLGTFIATFLYCLLVLRTVRGTDDQQFVPHLSVTVGVVLAMVSLGVLIFFIHHIATGIQASQIIANVSADLDASIDRLFPEQIGRAAPPVTAQRPPADRERAFVQAASVPASRAGYVQAVDGAALLRLAQERDVVLRIEARPGGFVHPGRPLASVAGEAAGDDVAAAIRAAFVIGSERTGTQDVGFFVDQLVELAVRALSPGINDPSTASACVDRLEQALGRLACRRLPSSERYDADGRLRVVAAPTTFAGMVETALTEIARHARSSVAVTSRVLAALRHLAPYVLTEVDRRALVSQAVLIGSRADGALVEADRRVVVEDVSVTVAALSTASLPRADAHSGHA